MARTGRPTKLTAALTAEIVKLIRIVVYEDTVADALGIDRTTFWRWKQRGEQEEEGLYHDFCNAIKKAKAETEIGLIRTVKGGAEGWQSKAWIAERAFQDHWGRKDKVEVTVRREAERLAQEVGCTADELIKEAERIAAAASAR